MNSLLIEDEKKNSNNNSKEVSFISEKKDNSCIFGHRNDFGEIIDIESQKKIYSRRTISSNESKLKKNIFNRVSNFLTNHKEENIRNSFDLNLRKKSSNDFSILKRSSANIIQEELIVMGYELYLINNLIKFFEITSIELAIEYLSKTNNKWNHPFLYFDIPENQNEDEFAKLAKEESLKSNLLSKNNKGENDIKCYVCGDNADLHLEYSKYKTPNGNSMTFYNTIESKDQTNINRSVDFSLFPRPEINQNSSLDINPKKKSNENSFDELIEKKNNDSDNILSHDVESKDESKDIEVGIIFTGEKSEIKKNSDEEYCDICMSESTDYFKLKCNHIFCKDCLSSYFINKFNNSNVEEITCPDNFCKQLIIPEIIKKLVSKEEYERYEKFLERNLIMKDLRNVICPIADCDSYAEYSEEIFNDCKKSAFIEIKNNTTVISNNINKNNNTNIDTNIKIENIKDVGSENNVKNSKIEVLEENNNDIIFISQKNKDNESILNPNEKEVINSNNENQLDKQKLISLLKSQKVVLVCKKNQHAFCNLCKKYSHGDSKCGKKLEDEYRRLVKNNRNIRKCPRCDFFIEKNFGCNHMTCYNRECKYQFCWLCMGDYDGGHYDNPLTPCFGMQYLDQENIMVRCPCLLYIKCLLFFILALILIPLAIALAPLSPPLILYLAIFIEDYYYFNRNSNKTCFHFIGILTYICLGIAFIPLGFLILSLGVVAGIFKGIYEFFNRCIC